MKFFKINDETAEIVKVDGEPSPGKDEDGDARKRESSSAQKR